MNKIEYMRLIKEGLKDIDIEVLSEIENDYNEHFLIGLEKGKTEEQICEELGSPEELIDEIKAGLTDKKPGSANTINNHIDAANAEPINTNSEDSNNTDNNDNSNRKSDYNNDNILDCTRICTNVINADLEIVRSKINKLDIKYNNYGNARQKASYRFECYQNGETMYANLVKTGIFGIFTVGDPDIEIRIELPDNIKSINASSASGEIKVTGINVESFNTMSASGDLWIEDSKAKFMDISSTSGDINGDNIKSKSIKYQTTSGDIKVRNIKSENLHIMTISGDANIYNTDNARIIANTTSGDIKIDGKSDTCELSSTSGDITLISTNDTNAKFNTVSGEVNVEIHNHQRGFKSNVSTVSGDVRIAYGEFRVKGSRGNEYKYGNESSKLSISTISGDISITD